MCCKLWNSRFALSLLPALLLIGHEASAQQGNGAFAEGVYVDVDGVLHTVMVGDKGDRLSKLRKHGTIPRATGDISTKTSLRRVSLAQLANKASACASAGKPVPDDLRYMAGIQQIQFVFVYPEENDIVIAGPAEGWEMDASGRVVGITTRRPVLRLDDLAVAMRVFPPDGNPNVIVGCTITQTEEGVRHLNQYLAGLGKSVDRRQIDARMVQGVRDSLGLQDVEVWGVPGDSRIAQVLVEADYRMKMIGIGLEAPRVRNITSFYSLLAPGEGGANKLQRWWFVPDYEAIIESDEGDAFEFRGQRAKLLASDDKLKLTGDVERGGSAGGSTKRFAQSFTAHYGELARATPVYADMQNAFDMIILAALMQQRNLIPNVAPELGFLLQSEGSYTPETFDVPKHAESVVNPKWIGTKLAIPVGGVVVEPAKVIGGQVTKSSSNGKLQNQRQNARLSEKAAGRWWTD